MKTSAMQWRRTVPWVGAVLLASTVAAPATWAAPQNVVANRSVVVGDRYHGATWGDESPYVFTGSFFDEVAASLGGTQTNPNTPDIRTKGSGTADQDSKIDPSRGIFKAVGSADIGNLVDQDLGYARSSFEVAFDLLTPHSYTLTGALDVGTDGGLGLAAFNLAGPTSFGFKKDTWGPQIDLNRSGVLAPGSYHLSLYALMQPDCEPEECARNSWMGGTSTFNVDFRVAAVPEPGSVAMLLAGLGAVGLVVRRKSRAGA